MTPVQSWLDPGRTCWRRETAPRAAVLIDTARYFEVALATLEQARRSVWILGWTFDTRTWLLPESPPTRIEAVLNRLAARGLDVRVLVWRSALPVAASQNFYPQRAARDFEGSKVRFVMDGVHPFGACHHQKVLVVDDEFAFCGGGDFSVDRWDTPAHRDRDPGRKLPSGFEHAPRHEVMMMVQGAPARALGDLARARWSRVTGETPAPVEAPDPAGWPELVQPAFRDVAVGVARSAPAYGDEPGAREAEALNVQAIMGAERSIYLENQYVTAPAIADALAKRLADPDGPEVVVVTTRHSPSYFDQATMDRARDGFIRRLHSADRYDRFRAYCPLTPGGKTVIVHSKVAVVDDRFLRVGSSNLNNRSAGFDTECDLAIESEDAAQRGAVRDFRNRLISHFLAVEPEAFARQAEAEGIGRAIDALDRGPQRRLEPLKPMRGAVLAAAFSRWGLGDPVEPDDAWRPWRRRAALDAQRDRLAAALVDRTSNSTSNGR